MKIKFNSDDKLPLNTQYKVLTITIVGLFFLKIINKYHPQVFLDECLYKIWKRKLRLIKRK